MATSRCSPSSGDSSHHPVLLNPPGFIKRPHFCHHGLASSRTSDTQQNPERRYYCCSRRGCVDDCGMLKWIDPELTSYYKSCFQRKHLQLQRAEEELNDAVEVNLINLDRLAGMDDVCNAMEKQIADLEAVNDAKTRFIEAILCRIQVYNVGFALVGMIMAYLFMR